MSMTNRTIRNPHPQEVAEALEMLKGKGGCEDESVLTDAGWEQAAGVVTLYCGHGSRAAAILRRCGSAVREMRIEESPDGHLGTFLTIDRSAFRGLEFAFKPIDSKSEPMPEEAKAALRAVRNG